MRSTTITFSREEKRDLFKTWILVGIVFLLASRTYSFPEVLFVALSAFLIGGISIIFHELAHKVVALWKGCSAQFRANNSMTVISVIVAFFGLILLAPGAVHVRGAQTRQESGLIALAGPGSNMLLAVLCALAMLVFTNVIITAFLSFGVLINSWLALFNLIPFAPFDGASVWKWNRAIYAASATFSIMLIILLEFL